jgi:hypothetical protein
MVWSSLIAVSCVFEVDIKSREHLANSTGGQMGGGLALMEEFKCGICWGVMCRPCLSLNCAHRFCKGCITRVSATATHHA